MEKINVFDLVQYYYCPRKIYFLRVMEVPVVIKRKMEHGREEQEKERKRVLERKDVFGIKREEIEDIIEKLHLESEKIGLVGNIDIVLRLKNKDFVPVDIKYSDFVFAQRHWKKQLTAYSMLLEEKFNCKVNKGILYFCEQNESLFVDINEDDKNFVLVDLEKIRDLFRTEVIPKKTDESKCRYCEVIKYCV